MPKRLSVLASAALLLVGCRKDPAVAPNPVGRNDAIPVSTERVTSVPLDRTLAVVGTLYARDEATLGAEVEGKVESTRVDFGDRVKAGQELALIDTATYETQARQAAANLTRAEANAANAEKELKRVQALGPVASQSDVDKAVSEAEQGRAEVKSADAADSMARLNLERSHVRAPFDAAIAERVVSAGDFVKVGMPLFRVVNDQILKYIVQAPERYAGEVEKGMPVVFTVDAFPGEKFTGTVYLISPQVNTATRSFAIGALVTNATARLRANTFARGELLLERAVPTAVVPLDAVVNFAGVTKVFVLDHDVARSREVQVGRIIEGRQEILAGLTPGETVIVSGQSKLYDGTKVRADKFKVQSSKFKVPKPEFLVSCFWLGNRVGRPRDSSKFKVQSSKSRSWSFSFLVSCFWLRGTEFEVRGTVQSSRFKVQSPEAAVRSSKFKVGEWG